MKALLFSPHTPSLFVGTATSTVSVIILLSFGTSLYVPLFHLTVASFVTAVNGDIAPGTLQYVELRNSNEGTTVVVAIHMAVSSCSYAFPFILHSALFALFLLLSPRLVPIPLRPVPPQCRWWLLRVVTCSARGSLRYTPLSATAAFIRSSHCVAVSGSIPLQETQHLSQPWYNAMCLSQMPLRAAGNPFDLMSAL